MDRRGGRSDPDRHRADRDADRELDEITSEVRIVLPGATLLFGFLITLPFTADFATLPSHSRVAYLLAMMCAGASIVLLLGGVAYHRLRARPYDKLRMVDTTSRQIVSAMALLAVALLAVVLLVVDRVFSLGWAIGLVAGGAVAVGVTWLGLPLARRRDDDA
jgi:hypothetical protein